MGGSLRGFVGRVVSKFYLFSLYCFLPVMPLLASIVFGRRRFVSQYGQTFKKCLIHVRAMAEGPALHYFSEVAGRVAQVPGEMQGECVQCGNCCMDRRCLFLEPMGEGKFGCGIYESPWRRFSNCGSFPLSQHDIDRYACPSYFLIEEKLIHFHKTVACTAPSTCS
jgi:hypothetical protein